MMGGGGTSNTDQLTFGGYGGPPGSQRFLISIGGWIRHGQKLQI